MSQGIQKLTAGVDRGIVGRNIAIAPWSILLEDQLLATADLQALEGPAEVVQQAEAMVEQLAEASVVGTEALHRHTSS